MFRKPLFPVLFRLFLVIPGELLRPSLELIKTLPDFQNNLLFYLLLMPYGQNHLPYFRQVDMTSSIFSVPALGKNGL